MFDRLIESDSRGANFRPRKRYFFVSSLVVGILFVSAVIFSIYAADIGLGNEEWDVSTLVPPLAAEAPDPPKPQPPKTTTVRQSAAPERQLNLQRPEESPADVPPISVTRNTQAVRPPGDFTIGPNNIDPPPMSGPPATIPGTGSAESIAPGNRETTSGVGTPPRVEPPPIRPTRPKYVGVVNGDAISLPKPPYPQIAVAGNIQGKVDVQVTIDETGKVISAKAASGHPFLRGPAEAAAWKARFNPTTLSDVPIKVTGVIVYNFRRN
jgi:TonB family protein